MDHGESGSKYQAVGPATENALVHPEVVFPRGELHYRLDTIDIACAFDLK